jgi:acyl-coenzyme A thioesterase PaaI-like protein
MTPEEQQERVRSSFAKQGFMTTLGATLGSVSPGMVEIVLRPHPAISQQHGFVHGGAVSAIADSAAGYAALTLMPAPGFSPPSSRSTFSLPPQASASLPVGAW